MEPAYALAVCIGCFSPSPLSGPTVPDRPAIRLSSPEDHRTTCFRPVDSAVPTIKPSWQIEASLR